MESLKNGQRYIGQTSNLDERMRRHNADYVRSTRNNAPWKLLAYLQMESRQEAIKLEEKLKRMKNRERVFSYFAQHGVILPH
ncbi:GIY-YIG nuclease family protein [Salinivirga cyanobacteriivorans]|uniref:GIY-YIG nuclease family protein n=1 Tax=Salinivirga cyanobacteriivorans TaxID=1307839 RepID=UPI0009D763B7